MVRDRPRRADRKGIHHDEPHLDRTGGAPHRTGPRPRIGNSINASGQVAGSADTALVGPFGSVVFRAFRADPGAPLLDLGTLAPLGGLSGFNNSGANALNDGANLPPAPGRFSTTTVPRLSRTFSASARAVISSGPPGG